jgi:chromosome segregation ATPase
MLDFSTFKRRSSNGSSPHSGTADRSRPAASPYDFGAMELLVTRAERAAEQLRTLDTTIDRAAQFAALDERIARIEASLAQIEEVAKQAEAAQDVAAEFAASQEAVAERVAASGAEVTRIRTSCSELLTKVDAALEFRTELDDFLTLRPEFAALRLDADAITGRTRDLSDTIDRLRSVHDDAVQAHRHATSRLDGIDQRFQATASKLDSIERRASSSEQALTTLLNLARGVPEVHHQLTVLKAITDEVTQKTAMVERQREGIDRVAAQVSHLVTLTSDLESAFRRQEEQAGTMTAIDGKLAALHTQHAAVLTRMSEIAATQRQLDEAERDGERALNALRADMQTSTERFEMENRSLDAVSERIASLRGGVKDCEVRLADATVAASAAAETDARVRALAATVAGVSDDVQRITVQAERLRAVRDDAGELGASVAAMTMRVERIEAARPSVEAVARDLASLSGTHEAVRDGLEQVRMAYTEMTRLRERHTEADAWLAETDRKLTTLRGHATELQGMRPLVDALRGQVDRVTASVSAIEMRSSAVDDLQRRIGELDSMVAQLGERGEAVRARMESAESRFGELSREAGNAQRVAATIAAVAATVEVAERRLSGVSGTIDTLEARASALDGLSERMRIAGQDLDQRQGALDAATQHLAHASTVRREAADAAQRLEDVCTALTTQLGTAGDGTAMVAQMLDELGGRVSLLGDVEKRMQRFEDLMAEWERAQTVAAHALEQISNRQAMIDAVDGQITHLGEIADRTAEDVRSIAAARRDVEETRALLDSTQDALTSATESMRGFEGRQQQVEQLERRLARADALASTVRSTVEVIAAQRSVVDQAMERSAALGLQVKQAEALSEGLRAQCHLATQLRSAVEQLRLESAAEEVGLATRGRG